MKNFIHISICGLLKTKSVMKLLFVPLFCALISVSFGCRCAPLRVDTYFCNSDFAIQMRVKSERHDPNSEDQLNSWYDIEVVKVYKTNDKVTKAFASGQIWTGQNSATCGRVFELNQNYIITGYLDPQNNRLRTHTCTFGRLLTNLSNEEKEFFENTYKSIDCSKLVN